MENVVRIDGNYAGVKNYACAYLVIEGKEAFVVDPTTNFAVPSILEELKKKGLTPEQLKYCIITHVHLAAKHIINPVGIIKGATGVYGAEEFKKNYGEIKPVPKEKVIVMEDKGKLKIGERELVFYYTLGHATHHFVVYDDKTKGIFTGDNFGINYPEFGKDYLMPTTTPIDFNPPEMLKSIDLIMNTGAKRAYLTHSGIWEHMENGRKMNVASIKKFHELCKEIPAKMKEFEKSEDKVRKWLEDEIVTYFETILKKSKEVILKDPRLKMDVFLNAWGCYVYVVRRTKKGLEI